jgi:hypothetical protein
MQQEVIDAFHATATVKRSDIFDDERLTPLTALIDAQTAAPGWVGRDWAPGHTVLMAINPGGGGDHYRRNPTDEGLYSLIRAFRDAAVADRGRALQEMSDAWIQIQSSHNIWKVVDAVLNTTKSDPSRSAFLNILPFRTRQDKPARSGELRRAWHRATGKQVESLAPRRIIALGRKAYDAIITTGVSAEHEIVMIKRAIGDSYIPPDARGVLAKLMAES